MYTLEDTQRIARDENTRESVKMYLMDRLIESIRSLADITDDQSTEICDSLEQGLTAISSSLNEISNNTAKLTDISEALNDIREELTDLNDYISALEDKLNTMNEMVETFNHTEGGDK